MKMEEVKYRNTRKHTRHEENRRNLAKVHCYHQHIQHLRGSRRVHFSDAKLKGIDAEINAREEDIAALLRVNQQLLQNNARRPVKI